MKTHYERASITLRSRGVVFFLPKVFFSLVRKKVVRDK